MRIAVVLQRLTFDRAMRVAWLLMVVWALSAISRFPTDFSFNARICGQGLYGACGPVRVELEHR